MGRVLGKEQFGLHAALEQPSHEFRTEWIDLSLCLQGERGRGRDLAHELELVLEARHDADAVLATELVERLAQEPTRAALPRRAVRLDDVAQNELEGALAGSCLDANLGFGVRQQPQVAGRAEGRVLGDLAEGRDRHVRRHPPDTRLQPRAELGGRQ